MVEKGEPTASSASQSLDRRRFLIGGALVAGSAITYARQPDEKIDLLGDRKLDSLVPRQIGSWQFLTNSGLVVPTEDALSAALYSELLTRVYTNGSEPPIMLLIAQSAGQSGFLQIHRPEYCYPAGGFELSPIVPMQLPAGGKAVEANRLTASLPGRVEQIIYFTRIGRRMPLSWAQQRLAVAMDNLNGIVPDAVLTRVSTIDMDQEAGNARLADFVEKMIAGMGAGSSVLVA
nr:exosortase-associated protein EpsI, V-type [uncultured Sphingomonas sp.]